MDYFLFVRTGDAAKDIRRERNSYSNKIEKQWKSSALEWKNAFCVNGTA